MPSPWIVRHGALRFLGPFDSDGPEYERGQDVVVRTDRGHELGAILCPATERAVELLSEPALR